MDAHPPGPATVRRLAAVLTLLIVPGLAGASVRSKNFAVEAPTPEAARQVAAHAETCRRTIARQWLGRELPTWPTPCAIKVRLNNGEAGGVTSFDFDGDGVANQAITVQGRLDRILASALPHEITHTIFAAYFGDVMPRWADEGASLLSEDAREKNRHEQIVVDLLARRRDYPLSRLFRFKEYPQDVMGFYGQGYSVSRFLVEIGGRPRFLEFVRDGSRTGWDAAARTHYGLADLHELDRAWRSWHRVMADNRPAPEPLVVNIHAGDGSAGE